MVWVVVVVSKTALASVQGIFRQAKWRIERDGVLVVVVIVIVTRTRM